MKAVLVCVVIAVAIGVVISDVPKYADSIMTRATGAKGVLMCGKLPAKNARVRLFRKESDDPKEILDYKITGADGRFEKGYRRFVIKYPKQFVTLGRIARSHYNVGTLNLEVIYPNEGREKNFVEGTVKNI
ncbi:hypothetical protein QR680_001351 [Steinernema hermaphroditum]|uniref:Transthyretin-like family protein n=1 Tax=Steinernema hermaphroditum TaxID=289476 RepID=A0AA39LFU9_9BILA|nr:hypothetical protein QR680_001351 [Steinernema hermaphroditum]